MENIPDDLVSPSDNNKVVPLVQDNNQMASLSLKDSKIDIRKKGSSQKKMREKKAGGKEENPGETTYTNNLVIGDHNQASVIRNNIMINTPPTNQLGNYFLT